MTRVGVNEEVLRWTQSNEQFFDAAKRELASVADTWPSVPGTCLA